MEYKELIESIIRCKSLYAKVKYNGAGVVYLKVVKEDALKAFSDIERSNERKGVIDREFDAHRTKIDMKEEFDLYLE